MARREYLISTSGFAGAQMTQESFPQALRDITPYLERPPVAHFDGEGEITHLVDGETGETIISLGEYYSLQENSYGVHLTPLELIGVYEALQGAVPGDSVEEKLGNISYAYFTKHLTTTSLEDLMAELEAKREDGPEWSVTHFPWGMEREALLERALRGFADVDWYNFNFYFARVLRDMALKFVKDGHTGDAAKDEKLLAMAAGFQHFLDQDNFDDEEFEYDPERTKEALEIFVELFHRLDD